MYFWFVLILFYFRLFNLYKPFEQKGFTVKDNTTLRRIHEGYCLFCGYEVGAITFWIRAQCVFSGNQQETVGELGMEEGDTITAKMEIWR